MKNFPPAHSPSSSSVLMGCLKQKKNDPTVCFATLEEKLKKNNNTRAYKLEKKSRRRGTTWPESGKIRFTVKVSLTWTVSYLSSTP